MAASRAIAERLMPASSISEISTTQSMITRAQIQYPKSTANRSPCQRQTVTEGRNNVHMKIGERVKMAREALSWSRTALAKSVGMPYSTLASLEQGDSAESVWLPKIAHALGMSAYELATGIPDAHVDDEGGDETLPRAPSEDRYVLVPQLDVAAACGDGIFNDHVEIKGGLAFKRSSLKKLGVKEHAARIIYAGGGSMSPTIQDGCVVLINTADRDPVDGKVYAICKPDGGLVLKRLIRDYHPIAGAQVWIMRSDNLDKATHPDKLLPPDDRTMIVGRAVWNDNKL